MSDVPELASDALELMVSQFSERLSFFRELIQNAVDAGSKEVDIWFEFQPPKPGEEKGLMIIDVDDYGEGMDRHIIETKLTRLFSSAKDGDLTKIGKFGIGFVSVFAIQPQAVCVDTTRASENWRVLFKEDRSFVLIERDTRVEGTKIKIVKSATEAEFEDYEERAYQTIKRWCKHLSAEVRFQDEPINEEFDVDAVVKARHVEEGTEIVVGYSRDGNASFGFYNKGLTLLEGRDEEQYLHSHVAYKVSSRYLEHTLTRDRIIEDSNFKKAMKIVSRLVEKGLVEALFETYEKRLQEGGEHEDMAHIKARLAYHLKHLGSLPKSIHERGIVRSISGDLVSLKRILEAGKKNRLLTAAAQSPLTDALTTMGYEVLESDTDMLQALGYDLRKSSTRAEAQFGLTQPAPFESPAWKALSEAFENLLKAHGAKVSTIALGIFLGAIRTWPVASQRELWTAFPVSLGIDKKSKQPRPNRELGTGLFAKKRALVVNANHDTVKGLLQVAPKEPEFAAYTLMKLFFLGATEGDAFVELDARLGALSVEMRRKRVG